MFKTRHIILLTVIIVLLSGCVNLKQTSESIKLTPISEYISMVCNRSIFDDRKKVMTRYLARSQEVMDKIIACNSKPLVRIYSEARRMNTDLEGTMIIGFTILPGGDVEKITLISSDIDDKLFENRVSELLMAFKFPKADVGKINMRYPVRFRKYDFKRYVSTVP